MAGPIIVVTGFFATVMSSIPTIPFENPGRYRSNLSAAFGVGTMFISKPAKAYSALSIAGSSLLISGLILALAFRGQQTSSAYIITVDCCPAFFYSSIISSPELRGGLLRIDASLTSIIGLVLLLTLIFQLALVSPGIKMILPPNILLE
jgi:hypothetical protein